MLARVLAVIVCVYVYVVCPSHAGIISKLLNVVIAQTTPRDSPGTLVF